MSNLSQESKNPAAKLNLKLQSKMEMDSMRRTPKNLSTLILRNLYLFKCFRRSEITRLWSLKPCLLALPLKHSPCKSLSMECGFWCSWTVLPCSMFWTEPSSYTHPSLLKALLMLLASFLFSNIFQKKLKLVLFCCLRILFYTFQILWNNI